MSEPLLNVKNLSVDVEEKSILHGINLTINKGETHVLMGPNGAGKSTLGCTLMGNPNYHVTDGEIFFGGENITKEAADFLKKLVEGGYNIFISGGTGSGKTTFLNTLSNYIPRDERIITIEDSAELQLLNTDNLVRMETRQANTEGENEITIRDLIKTALRMRPDRIIVGEVRGAEAVDMLQAMNTGHDGSMCTGHANSAQDMMYRLENMVLTGIDIPLEAIKSQIGAAIDIVVHLGRLRDKTRKVMTIHEMVKDEK